MSDQDRSEDWGLLALSTGGGDVVYPAFQFGDPLVADGVVKIVELLPADLVSPWMVAAWLASDDVELNGARPIDVIADGGITRVLAIAAERATALDLVPQASLEQTRWWQQIRARLLATPVLDYDALAELRHDTAPSATRIAVSRQQTAHQLFTVTHNGEQLIPAFRLTEDGSPRPELAPILVLLMDGGVDGWQLWMWLTAPTPHLSGDVPNEVAATEPHRAVQAAQRFIDKAATTLRRHRCSFLALAAIRSVSCRPGDPHKCRGDRPLARQMTGTPRHWSATAATRTSMVWQPSPQTSATSTDPCDRHRSYLPTLE